MLYTIIIIIILFQRYELSTQPSQYALMGKMAMLQSGLYQARVILRNAVSILKRSTASSHHDVDRNTSTDHKSDHALIHKTACEPLQYDFDSGSETEFEVDHDVL